MTMGTATTLMILPTDGVLAYYPGEEVTGRVTWALPDGSTPAGAAELRLYWFTTGKGRRGRLSSSPSIRTCRAGSRS